VTAPWLLRLAQALPLSPLSEALARGERVSLSGLVGSARQLLPLLVSQGPLLVVVPRERDVEETAQDLRQFAEEAGLSGLIARFPSPGPSPFRGLPRHPEAGLLRAAALHAAARGELRALVASPYGLLRPSLAPERFQTRVLGLRCGEEMTPEMLIEALDECGYRREDPVTSAGQMARRGGILDVFPPDREQPVRLEFFGDTLESLRSFDPRTQRSSASLESVEFLPLSDLFPTRSLLEPLKAAAARAYAGSRLGAVLVERLERGLVPDEVVELLPLVPGATLPAWEHLRDAVVVTIEPEDVAEEAEGVLERWREDRRRGTGPDVEAGELLVAPSQLAERTRRGPVLQLRELGGSPGEIHLSARPVRRYAGDVRALCEDLQAGPGRAVLFLGSRGRAERLADVLREAGIPSGPDQPVDVRVGALGSGFELAAARLRVLADGDVFPEEVRLQPRGRGRGLRSFLSDFRDLKLGDLVVHQDHGIGRFEGLESLEVGGQRREFMVLVYQAGDKLKVPVEAFDRVQKYATAEGARPVVDRLGSGSWERVKKRVRKAMREMAAELLRLYAERKARPGHAFSSESPWQREFEEAFEYEETPDQAAAIAEIAADMALPAPMDRLICGDVGYGKTELAMRAAMRAILDGKQVALLAPTTVLAFQHWKTLGKRFAPFPVTIQMASRFRPAREIKEVLAATAAGAVDILIGTHRILSKDVAFRDLGLLIVDEEQRFGVAAKERLKQLRTSVDCITLSATPIPRTLQMGLAGIRDMSVIETPPKDRLAIQTSIVKFSTDVIGAAIRQELARDGQVFFVHNRVESIYSLAGLVQRLVPEARVAVAHGQMPELELEKAMLAFVEGRADVLVATTIIENGLDIPRANTLIVNRADRYGLSQLYQLRGRVGRADRQAYAWLMVPPDTVLSELARKRLAAIREFSDLGAGFRIAALDLELRGAGNLLGGQQSGHIEAVGLDLYVKLLEQTILELRGDAAPESERATLNLRVDLRIPSDYVPSVEQRLSLYKRASQARSPQELAALGEEIRDRYGPPPREAETLLEFASQRLRADALGVSQVDRVASGLALRLVPRGPVPPEALVGLAASLPGAALTPEGVLRLPDAGNAPLAALAQALDRLEALVPVAASAL
jgi:transcription-repair coupling factor (superfamily II helicase)